MIRHADLADICEECRQAKRQRRLEALRLLLSGGVAFLVGWAALVVLFR